MMEEEIWKDITGWEGRYKISNQGRVMSVFKTKTKIKKPHIDGSGHLSLNLVKNYSFKSMAVHRLVAMAFIPNPENKRTVNHKNGIKTDNRVDNLEWMTYKENSQHAFRTGLSKPTCIGRFNEKHPMSRIVHQYSIDGRYIKSFPSVSEAGRSTNGSTGSIWTCANSNNSNRSLYGYKWSFEKRDEF